MHYQLNLHLASAKKDYYWLFKSEEDTMTVFNEVVETFRQYEPRDADAFAKEQRREIDQTGKSNSVQIEVVKVDKEAIIRSASYTEMFYEEQHFDDIYETLTGRLGAPEEQSLDTV